jgi:hypothetical protein
MRLVGAIAVGVLAQEEATTSAKLLKAVSGISIKAIQKNQDWRGGERSIFCRPLGEVGIKMDIDINLCAGRLTQPASI